MDFLKAEIARKKQQMANSEVMAPDKKYFKRGDLAAKQEEEYWKKHKRLKASEADQASSRSNSPDIRGDRSGGETSSEQDKEKSKPMLSRKEVIRRLRERMEPIILFGESEFEAHRRLRKLEIMEPEVNKGYKNDLKAAMDQVDNQYLQEILKASGQDDEAEQVNDVKVHDDGTTMEQISKLAEKFGQGDSALDSEVILKFLKYVLKLWGNELNERPEEDKRGYRGKIASATFSQTVTYLKPLFRNLKKNSMQEDIMECLVDILRYMLNRDYIKANDAYLEMAIGNAPWPIGVTMVGIHARTGREKIFARNVAHVLNDETQRKYIQALKRLMTKSQKYFPTDPSHSVDFEPLIH